MLVDIVEARPVGAHVLHIRFADGVEGKVDLDRILLWKGVFEALRDPVRFAEVRVDPELGTIVWPNGADIDPDVLYAAVTGRPVPLPERLAPR